MPANKIVTAGIALLLLVAGSSTPVRSQMLSPADKAPNDWDFSASHPEYKFNLKAQEMDPCKLHPEYSWCQLKANSDAGKT